MNRTSCHPLPGQFFLGRWALCPHLIGLKSGGGGLGFISPPPRGACRNPSPCLPVCAHCLCLAQPLAAASAPTTPNLQEGQQAEPLGVLCPGMLRWWNLASGRCQ